MELPNKQEILEKVEDELKKQGWHKYQLEHLREPVFLALDFANTF